MKSRLRIVLFKENPRNEKNIDRFEASPFFDKEINTPHFLMKEPIFIFEHKISSRYRGRLIMLTVDQEWLHYHDDKMIDFDAVCYSNGIWREPDILTKPEAKKPHQLYAPFRRVFIVPERAIIINASSKEPLNETKLLIYELMLKRDFSANMITVTAAKLWSGSPKKLPDRFKFLEKSIALSIRNLKALTELVDKKWLKKYKKSCEKQGK